MPDVSKHHPTCPACGGVAKLYVRRTGFDSLTDEYSCTTCGFAEDGPSLDLGPNYDLAVRWCLYPPGQFPKNLSR